MVVDAVRTYLDAASGLTELSRKQAVAAAKVLLRADGPTAPRAGEAGEGESLPPRVGQSIQTLAGELIETSQSNRAAITDLVRSEVERQLERMDVVPRSEHERLVRRVAELERRLAARHAVERVLVTADAGASSPVPTADTDTPDGGSAPAAGTSGPDGSGTGPEEADPSDASPEADAGGTEQEDGTGTDSAGAAKKAAAKSRPRPAAKGPAKTTRTRSNAKRTTKGKGATKK